MAHLIIRETTPTFLQIPHFMMDIYNSLTDESSGTGEMRPEIEDVQLANSKFQLSAADIKVKNLYLKIIMPLFPHLKNIIPLN